MDKLSALIVGSLASAAVVAAAAGIVSRDSTITFLVGVAYLVLCAFGAIVLPFNRLMPKKEEISARRVFWMPFVPIFLMPLWVAVFALVHEWRVEQPVLRYTVISVCFLLTVPALLLQFYLSGYRSPKKEEPIQSTTDNDGAAPRRV